MLNGVIFDLDGLLVDTERFYKEGWLWGFKQFDLTIPTEVVDAWGGKNWKQSFDLLVSVAGSEERVQEIRAKREEYFYEQLKNGTIELKPYAKETLVYLKEQGLTLGIATTTVKQRAMAIIDQFELADFFDTFTFGDEVSENKPSPIPYLTALEKSHLTADTAFAVEDSIVGATAASRADMGVILIPDSSFDRNYTKEDKAQLKLIAEGTDLRVVIEKAKELLGTN